MNKYEFDEKKELDLICIGRLGIDLNCVDFNCPLSEVKSFRPTVGGSPANIAIGSSKLGIKVGFIGKISNDGLGDYIIKELKRNCVDISGVVRDQNGAKNCLAITEVISPNNCGGVLYREGVADLNLSYEDISEEYIKSAKALMISGTALAKSPSREAVMLSISYAKKHGVQIIMDVDYRPYSWNCMEDASLYTSLLCESSDIIIGTREEMDVVEYLYDSNNEDDYKSAKRWLDRNAKVVVIKRGMDGSTAWTKDGDEYNSGIYPADLKKTFGAGDAYASGFTSTIIKGGTIQEAMQNGSAAATIVVSSYDCSESSPTEEELEDYKKTHIQN